MKNSLPVSTFTTPLGASIHQQAERFCQQHPQPEKAKQVYLNTLAVAAVQFYLNCMGIETDQAASENWNLIMQVLMNTADLTIPGLGRLDCRPVLPQATVMQIPLDVLGDRSELSGTNRLGHVAVQLDPSLRTATLLGFIPSSDREEVPIDQLRSLDTFLDYLRQLQRGVTLSHWLQGVFKVGWRSLDDLMNTSQPVLSFRNKATTVRRAKLLNLELQLEQRAIVLLIAITPETEQDLEIVVQAHPLVGELLPPDLWLRLLTETGEVLQEVRSRRQDNYIQLKRFQASAGEHFDLQVALGEVSITESFFV